MKMETLPVDIINIISSFSCGKDFHNFSKCCKSLAKEEFDYWQVKNPIEPPPKNTRSVIIYEMPIKWHFLSYPLVEIISINADSILEKFPDCLETLVIHVDDFIRLKAWPKKLEYLEIIGDDDSFNDDVTVTLPEVKTLILKNNSLWNIILPSTLEFLYLETYSRILYWPDSITKLYVYKYNYELYIPPNVKYICSHINDIPLNFPDSVETIEINYLNTPNLPKNLKVLIVFKCDIPLNLPESLEELYLQDYNHYLDLPKNLKILDLEGPYTHPLNLPKLKLLKIDSDYPFDLPASIKVIKY